MVKGKNIGSCLGDEFSISWMEDADKGMAKTETLEDQFNYLVKQVTKSHVSRYGDLSLVNDPIGEFIGYPEAEEKRNHSVYHHVGFARQRDVVLSSYDEDHHWC